MSIRILVDAGNYFSDNKNLGDEAIYQTIVDKLRQIWPRCTIQWITRNPCLVPIAVPPVLSVGVTQDRQSLCGVADSFRWHRVHISGSFAKYNRQAKNPGYVEKKKILHALSNCDLVLATGGGYFTDSFARHAWTILDTLEAGIAIGKPTVILGCGFEPIRDPIFSEKMLKVLPKVALIACREHLQSPAVVRSFGVAAKSIAVSGDGAVEMAFTMRPAVLGNAIGINFRQADYAGVEASVIAGMREVIHTVAKRLHAPLLAIPISLFGPSDPDVIRNFLGGTSGETCDGRNIKTPAAAIEQAGRCRLVITGSYHAAVFALSQGISVVALVSSSHYRAKLQGLQAHFGAGCQLVRLNIEKTHDNLRQAIEERWCQADAVRPELLRAAQRQIDASNTIYTHLCRLVDNSTSRKHHQPAAEPAKGHVKNTVSKKNSLLYSDFLTGFSCSGTQAAMIAPSPIELKISSMQTIEKHTSGLFALTPLEIDTFREQGFVGPFTAFSSEEMDQARQVIYERVLTTPTPYCPFGLRVRHLDSRTVYDLCSSPAIIGRMASLYGPDLVLWSSNLFNKPPAENGCLEAYPWHQDHYNWNMEPVLNISAWIAIGPANSDNGCVEVIPGSHKLVVPSVVETDPEMSARFGGIAADPVYVDETKKVALELKSGEFFLFNERLLHHSNPNRTASPRLGLAMRVTIPIVKVTEYFPSVMLSGKDYMGFNRFAEPPSGEPDSEWVDALQAGHEFVFDRAIPGMGWHLRESNEARYFAWTGLEPETWIDFRPVGAGDWLLRCEILHIISQEALSSLQIWVNGEVVTVNCHYVDNQVILDARLSTDVLQRRTDRIRITFSGAVLIRPCDLDPQTTDKRRLGVAFTRIALMPDDALQVIENDRIEFNGDADFSVGEPNPDSLEALQAELEFAFDRAIPGMGWHAREWDGSRHFAWTGVQSEAWIDFRPVGSGDYLLRCEILHIISGRTLDGLQISVNGEIITANCRFVDNQFILEARLSAHLLQRSIERLRIAFRDVVLVRPCDVNPETSDQRTLGIAFTRIALIFIDEPQVNYGLPHEICNPASSLEDAHTSAHVI